MKRYVILFSTRCNGGIYALLLDTTSVFPLGKDVRWYWWVRGAHQVQRQGLTGRGFTDTARRQG